MYIIVGTNICLEWFLQANEVLMAGVKLTSTEAYERGLVSSVFPQSEFQQRLTEAVQHIASLPPKVPNACMYTLL